ncbi:MAG: hypothetical protein HY717_03825 [Planctomycetes bacterium]|nr:hypothetical protein [Planctomycetota bacterium]
MNPKSGKVGSAVSPAAPSQAAEADVADPGQVAKTKAEQIEAGKGKYGSTPAKPHKPPQSEEEKEKKKSWVEIKMVDRDGKPVAGEKYKITLPDGSVAQGTLSEKGEARLEGIEPGKVTVEFPNLKGKPS